MDESLYDIKGSELDIDWIDIEFSSIMCELDALRRHLTLIEDEILEISREAKNRKKRSIQKIRKENLDPVECDIECGQIEFDHHQMITIDLPRLLRGSFVVILFAAFEATNEEIMRFVKEQRNSSKVKEGRKQMSDIFKDCKNESPDGVDNLEVLKYVRDAYAHSNGRFEAVNMKTQRKIDEYLEKDIGIQIVSGFIVISKTLLQSLFDSVVNSIECQIKTTKERYETDS